MTRLKLLAHHKESLEKFDVDPKKAIAVGMQSVVIDNLDDTVTKIYKEEDHLADLFLLKEFYDSLDTTKVRFTVPKIIEVEKKDGFYKVIEKKLSGSVLNRDALKTLSKQDLEKFTKIYVNTLFDIRKIGCNYLGNAELLTKINTFFVNGFSDWNLMVKESVSMKNDEIGVHFDKKVKDYNTKLNKILNSFKDSYTGQNDLIHGDYFPGNVLVGQEFNIKSVLDFGTLTTKGDYLFDIATGWVFVDMYDEVSMLDLKQIVFEDISTRLSKNDLSKVYLYLLVYSIISANMYSKDCNDGHFEWCATNLNNSEYWKNAFK